MSQQIVDLKRDEAQAAVRARAEAGEDPLKIVKPANGETEGFNSGSKANWPSERVVAR